MIENVADRTETQNLVADNATMFTSNVVQALKADAFSNRMMIAPRRLGQIGQEEFTHFCSFLETQDARSVVEHGHQLALEGLGHSSIVNLARCLRQTSRSLGWTDDKGSNLLNDLTERYTSGLLEGYMQGREDELRQEQERTHAAFLRSQS